MKRSLTRVSVLLAALAGGCEEEPLSPPPPGDPLTDVDFRLDVTARRRFADLVDGTRSFEVEGSVGFDLPSGDTVPPSTSVAILYCFTNRRESDLALELHSLRFQNDDGSEILFEATAPIEGILIPADGAEECVSGPFFGINGHQAPGDYTFSTRVFADGGEMGASTTINVLPDTLGDLDLGFEVVDAGGSSRGPVGGAAGLPDTLRPGGEVELRYSFDNRRDDAISFRVHRVRLRREGDEAQTVDLTEAYELHLAPGRSEDNVPGARFRVPGNARSGDYTLSLRLMSARGDAWASTPVRVAGTSGVKAR